MSSVGSGSKGVGSIEVPGDVHPSPLGAALHGEHEARKPLADVGLEEPPDDVSKLPLVVVAAFAGAVEEDHQRVGLGDQTIGVPAGGRSSRYSKLSTVPVGATPTRTLDVEGNGILRLHEL